MKFLMDSEEYSLATQFGKSNCFTIVFHSSVVQKVIMYINDRDFFLFELHCILLRLILNYDMVLALLLKKIRCKICVSDNAFGCRGHSSKVHVLRLH